MGSEKFTSPPVLVASLLGLARHRRAIVAIAGPPGTGKSTFAEHLRDALNARAPGTAEVLPGDGYHFDDLLLNARGWRPRKGAPHTFDVGGLRAMLERLRANVEDEVAVPVFDRSIEIARAGARVIPRSASLVLVEGNYLLLDRDPWSSLAPLFDATIMLVAPLEILRERLLERWTEIGLSGADLAAKMEGNDLRNVATVLEGSRAADHLVDATLAWTIEAEEPAGPRAGSQARG
jgi:pantothenate kinase